MLGLIPMKHTASIYRTTGALDAWGLPTLSKTYTGNCYIEYDFISKDIPGGNGIYSGLAGVIYFPGKQTVIAGDSVECTTELGTVETRLIVTVEFIKDLGGKVLFTKVVFGHGKR